MTRIADSANGTELAKPAVWLALLVELDFPSGTLYATDAVHEITYGGHTYLPTGDISSIGSVQEAVETIARPLTMSIAGYTDLISKARDEIYQGERATIRLAPLDERTGQPVGVPEVLWEGRMDSMRMRGEERIGVIELTCEHRLRREPRIARNTNVDQQMAYSGDLFFEHTPEISGYVAHWGQTPVGFMGPSRGSLGSAGTGTAGGGAPITSSPPGRAYVKPN